jgi:hypothetical protein
VEKRVAYHLISSPYRSTGDMLPFFRANELSVGWRYTTADFRVRGRWQCLNGSLETRGP